MNATRVKLTAFAVVTVLALSYGLTQLFSVQHLVHPPYEVRAVFADPEGLFPRAEVDLLGVPVGSVAEIVPGPDGTSVVVMRIESGTEVPRDVRAAVSAKSAIGEQYVQLTPSSAGAPYLADGDTIALERTTSPPDLASLLKHTDALVGSVPLDAMHTVVREGAEALGSSGPALRRVLDDLDTLSASALRNADDLTSLIDGAQRVLRTQVDLAPSTRSALRDLAALTTTLRRLDPTFAQVFARGIQAGEQVTGLLRDNQAALPVLLNHLQSLADLGEANRPGIRKSLVVFPWMLEYNSQALRYCDKVDPVSGKPVAGTCHYDSDGLPIWSVHIADVLTLRKGATAQVCFQGYEGTPRHLPNGLNADGSGPPAPIDYPPNYEAGCTASPYSKTPNVRGYQNIEIPPVPGFPDRRAGRHGGADSRPVPGWGQALLDPESGVVVTPDGLALHLTSTATPVPTDGTADLGWLLTRNLTR